MAECKENVGRGIVSFPCYLEPGHDGPHVSHENVPSQHARRAWEVAVELESLENAVVNPRTPQSFPPRQVPHPEAESLGQFQGTPKTSQTGLMESGAPVEERSTAPLTTVDTSHGAPTGPVRPRVVSQTTPLWADAPVEPPVEPKQVSAPTKTREGDQPLPVVNDESFVQDLVIADFEARKAVGIERYGTPLQAFNGRNVDLDLYEELLDATTYLKQKLVERESMAETVVELHRALEGLLGAELPLAIYERLELLYTGLRVNG